ncbi:MAG: LPO_1073/Vpar_1526 family protein [Planctomycetota bacterium]
MSKQPSVKTIKRLFALSRNVCAYPGCPSVLVDAAGVVTGKVCHIRAQNPEGPRYDPTQTDDERHGFANLVLMCDPHHKRIDERWQDYPVDRLIEIKHAHETSKGPEPSDAVAEELLRNSGFTGDVTQSAGDHGVNVAAAGGSLVVVQAGLSYEDVRQVALDVYRTNALELRGTAEAVARERADRLVTDFLGALRKQSPTPPTTLADPDMQSALFEAQRTAARTGDQNVAEVLVGLLVDRANQPLRDLKQIVLTEAVETVGRLTPAQFDALTLVFILKYTRDFGVRDVASLAAYFQRTVTPFLAAAATTRASFQHLEYAGCATIGIGAVNLWDALGKTYPHCFIGPVPVSEVEAAKTGGSIDRLVAIGLFTREGETQLRLCPVFDKEAAVKFPELGLDPASVDRLWAGFRGKANSTEVAAVVRGVYPAASDLEAWWKEHPAHLQLTSVGIAVAHANLRRRGLEGFDLGMWIN